MKRALLLIAACAAVYAIAAGWAGARLPENDVAMHVNAAGEVTKYSSRSGAVTMFVALGGVVFVLALGMIGLTRWSPVRHLSIPNKSYWTTSDRAPVVREMMLWDISVLFGTALVALSFIPVDISLTTTNQEGTSAFWIVVPIGLWLVATAVYIIWMVTRRYRP
jgi:hypothetical protein